MGFNPALHLLRDVPSCIVLNQRQNRFILLPNLCTPVIACLPSALKECTRVQLLGLAATRAVA
ncbi:hypothetical protein [Chroococcidiopsis sp. SAG 2025]|uniref:hypothetical protein n=1 Tax=Chroococcidiopsis sp. SAG 2025 TaxID=171389 RepID=UPI0029371CFA|nr:hypothetical protein [Chroococcidiopsis sp. SAG 2025]